MKRFGALLALMAAGCTTMEPTLTAIDPAVPSSWPAGNAALTQAEAALPAVTYKQVFTDVRLQTLISQALANNRDLMIAAANIAVAREQYRIQRAEQLPQVNANGGVTLSGDDSKGVKANYDIGLQVPSFELDFFGRLRSLTKVQLERYLATEAGARSTRLALVADIASAWLDYGADRSLLLVSQQTAAAAEKSVRLTDLRLKGGVAPRTDLSQSQEILSQAQANLALQRTNVAQDVNALQLLVGAPVDPSLLPATIDEAGPTIAALPAGLSSAILLRRPDVVQAEYQLRAANANIGAARAALFPKISLTGLLGFASSALTSLFSGGAFAWSVGADASYTIFQAGAGHANVRLSEDQRNAALATYQKAIQTAFREVADALARRATMDGQLAATQRQNAAAADVAMLVEARYHNGIDSYLNLLDAQRSYYQVQQVLVQTKLTAAQNRVALYQALGGDSLLQNAALCDVRYVTTPAGVTLANRCPPLQP